MFVTIMFVTSVFVINIFVIICITVYKATLTVVLIENKEAF
jgi:hypothetical protein